MTFTPEKLSQLAGRSTPFVDAFNRLAAAIVDDADPEDTDMAFVMVIATQAVATMMARNISLAVEITMRQRGQDCGGQRPLTIDTRNAIEIGALLGHVLADERRSDVLSSDVPYTDEQRREAAKAAHDALAAMGVKL